MRIDNFTQLYNILKPKNILPDFIRIVDDYILQCVCEPSKKEEKRRICSAQYVSAISYLTQHKSILFSVIKDYIIEFYNDGEKISSIRK
jgi:hypothetical protein